MDPAITLFFRQNGRLMVISTLAGLLVGLSIVLLFLKPAYESTASVLIKDVSTAAYVTTELERGSSFLKPVKTDGDPILTQKEILKSQFLMDYLERYIKQRYPQESVKKLDKHLKIKNPVGTDMLTVSFMWNTPEKSKEFLQVILREYDRINLSINERIHKSRSDFINRQAQEIADNLLSVRQKIRQYRTQSLVMDLPGEALALSEQRSRFATQLENTVAAMAGSRQTIAELSRQLGMNSGEALKAVAVGASNENMVSVRKDLLETQAEYDTLAAKYTNEHPKMIALKAKLASLDKEMGELTHLSTGGHGPAVRVIFDPVREKLAQNLAEAQAQLKSLGAQQTSLSQTLGKLDQQRAKFPNYAFDLDQLAQQERSLSRALDALTEKQLEARIKEAEVLSNIFVIDPPTKPETSANPSSVLILLVCMILGGGAGLGLGLFRYQRLFEPERHLIKVPV
jgi:uncharacterized protein involved in exopolysaccharide biosynthesis